MSLITAVHQWKQEFCRDVFSSILELSQSAIAPPYKTILEIETMILSKPLPKHLDIFMDVDDPHFTPLRYARGCVIRQNRANGLSIDDHLCCEADLR